MKTLVWNTCELGNPWEIRTLWDMVRREAPHLVFLQETWLLSLNMEKLRYELGYPNYLVVDCTGRSGGLVLLWNSDVQLMIHNYSNNHIHTTIMDNNANKQD